MPHLRLCIPSAVRQKPRLHMHRRTYTKLHPGSDTPSRRPRTDRARGLGDAAPVAASAAPATRSYSGFKSGKGGGGVVAGQPPVARLGESDGQIRGLVLGSYPLGAVLRRSVSVDSTTRIHIIDERIWQGWRVYASPPLYVVPPSPSPVP
jgi:hypothetical protein